MSTAYLGLWALLADVNPLPKRPNGGLGMARIDTTVPLDDFTNKVVLEEHIAGRIRYHNKLKKRWLGTWKRFVG
jgi:hypothetical protein